jgi:hypothetical protein
MEMVDSCAQVVVSQQQVTARQSLIGMVLARQVTLEEGSRVLLNTPQAIAFGAAVGAAFGVVLWRLLANRPRISNE